MAETQTPKAVILSFPYRRTGMRGFDDTILLSFRSNKPIKSILKTSGSGRHGTRSYKLFQGKYLVYQLERSNGGNLYAVVKIIRLGEDGKQQVETEWRVFDREPKITLNDLPGEIREILIANKDALPLFGEVFPFDDKWEDNIQEEGE